MKFLECEVVSGNPSIIVPSGELVAATAPFHIHEVTLTAALEPSD